MSHIIGGDCVSVQGGTSLRWLVIVFCFSLDVVDWIFFKKDAFSTLRPIEISTCDSLWCCRRCIGYFWTLSVCRGSAVNWRLWNKRRPHFSTVCFSKMIKRQSWILKKGSGTKLWRHWTTIPTWPDLTYPLTSSRTRSLSDKNNNKKTQTNSKWCVTNMCDSGKAAFYLCFWGWHLCSCIPGFVFHVLTQAVGIITVSEQMSTTMNRAQLFFFIRFIESSSNLAY